MVVESELDASGRCARAGTGVVVAWRQCPIPPGDRTEPYYGPNCVLLPRSLIFLYATSPWTTRVSNVVMDALSF